MKPPVTVLDVLKTMFPRVAPHEPPYPIWPAKRVSGTDRDYQSLPIHPFDVFAATAHLIELSGAYHHIVAEDDGDGSSPIRRQRSRQRALRVLAVGDTAMRSCIAQGDIWRQPLSRVRGARDRLLRTILKDLDRRLGRLQPTAQLWSDLVGHHGDAAVFTRLRTNSSPPTWWRLALQLLITADEASKGVGFRPVDDESWDDIRWFERPYIKRMLEDYERRAQEPDGSSIVHRALAYTSLSEARQDVVCVLPKARTTAVGCTLRSLSHHLALLPPIGIARGRWYPATDHKPTLDDIELNVLLVPFPFSIGDTAFQGAIGRSRGRNVFGFFDLHQEWLDAHRADPEQFIDKLCSFIVDLADDAKSHKALSIDAVVFPELALNFEIFTALKTRLKARFPGLELLVSGLHDDGKGRCGNFVAVSVMPKRPADILDDVWLNDSLRPTVREKHHRWKLDRHQLEQYELSGALNPKLEWWEDIDLLSRCVDFTVFRKDSALAAMICEDLARVDPCQELLRAVGPNLVVALLMDAPQLPTRWPARYATVLSDDPGSAVLTLTSRGLMTRQHLRGRIESKCAEDRVVALWRDDHYGIARPIACPNDCHGVWLKIWGARVVDTSLDGRSDTGVTWIYGKHRPLRVRDAEIRYPEILGPDDVKLQQLLREERDRSKYGTTERERDNSKRQPGGTKR